MTPKQLLKRIEEISKGDFSNLRDMVDVIPVDAEYKKKLKDGFKAAAILFDVLPSDIKSMVQKVTKDIINKDLDNLVKEGDDLPAEINFKKMLKKAVDDKCQDSATKIGLWRFEATIFCGGGVNLFCCLRFLTKCWFNLSKHKKI